MNFRVATEFYIVKKPYFVFNTYRLLKFLQKEIIADSVLFPHDSTEIYEESISK
ncbi:DNA-directed RNA polymerase beta subunit [Candidatus Brocadia sinica JPN1]|uniref:DNA-directed RNA polymerase beta subunit n=1 Tax=Candidatus Brocadia sinica JPN1 TaxID=1197129 RepID=A0ABQ0JXK3_9BACT|nr:DNA-directed RNA polymerase beta subunit [Candidatus Brocadia sinica JPN1]